MQCGAPHSLCILMVERQRATLRHLWSLVSSLPSNRFVNRLAAMASAWRLQRNYQPPSLVRWPSCGMEGAKRCLTSAAIDSCGSSDARPHCYAATGGTAVARAYEGSSPTSTPMQGPVPPRRVACWRLDPKFGQGIGREQLLRLEQPVNQALHAEPSGLLRCNHHGVGPA
jgi:hypothetical protein